MPVISIKNGKGITFDGNSLTTDVDNTDNLIEKKSDGLYVPSLQGKDGTGGGSYADGLTILETDTGSKKLIRLNVDYVQCIFAMSKYEVTGRNQDGSNPRLTCSSNIKTIHDIRKECNVNSSCNWTTYLIRNHDLFMLRTLTHPSLVGNMIYAMDDGNRYTGDDCVALFVVDECVQVNYYMSKLVMTCVWSSLSQYIAGQTYTSSD